MPCKELRCPPHTQHVGAAFALLTASYAATSPLDGWITEKLGGIRALTLGLGTCASAFLLLVRWSAGAAPCALPPPTVPWTLSQGPSPVAVRVLPDPAGRWSLALALGSLSAMGFGLGLCFVPALPAMIEASSSLAAEGDVEDFLGGMLNSLYFLGGAIGAPLGAWVTENVGFRWGVTSLATALVLTLVVMEATHRLARSPVKITRVRSLEQPLFQGAPVECAAGGPGATRVVVLSAVAGGHGRLTCAQL